MEFPSRKEFIQVHSLSISLYVIYILLFSGNYASQDNATITSKAVVQLAYCEEYYTPGGVGDHSELTSI